MILFRGEQFAMWKFLEFGQIAKILSNKHTYYSPLDKNFNQNSSYIYTMHIHTILTWVLFEVKEDHMF